MRLEYARTTAAVVLTLVAVAIPCGAWLVGGLRQLDQEAELKERSIYSSAQEKGLVLAERLATRFELLRKQESQRPFYEYQNLYHDPKAAAEGLSVAVSPLAKGSSDPLVGAYFQVDGEGGLSLPTLNDDFPELGHKAAEESQCELLWELQDVAIFSKLESAEAMAGGSRWRSEVEDSDGFEEAPENPFEEDQIELLTQAEWSQHLTANALYGDLKYQRGQVAATSIPGDGPQMVEILVTPLGWHKLTVAGEPSLVALRRVDTPAGLWTQGFVISTDAVSELVASPAYKAIFEPRSPGKPPCGPGEVRVAVEGTPWQVTVDVEDKLAAAAAELGQRRGTFWRTFIAASLGAGLAGLLVILMVLHSERLAKQRSQFAAAAAHELRTPLAGLRLYGEMLAEGLGSPERAADYARRMAGEAERLGRVVTNVLSFTRLERGALALHPEEGRLQEVVNEAYQRQRMAIEEAGATVELRLDEDLPTIAFDRDAVNHIVQNLLDNAERYTRDVEDRRIVLSLTQETKNVVLAVADNGRGISKSLQRRLFRPFSRGGDKGAPEGLGLGLVLVRLLARAQGAEITYQDAPRGGAVFRVAFPLERTA